MMASKTTTTTKKKKATEKKPTWWWKSDDDWVEYDAKLSARLEKGYQSGESEVKVDDERFVDLENLLQRRYDDRMKRRGVKRVPPPILDEMVVWLILPAKLKKEHVTLIEEHGGLIASNLNKGVTHVVCRQRDVEKQKQQLLQARKWKCKLVDEQYLNSCTEKLAILPINDHKLDLGEDEEEEEEEEEEEAEASSSTSKKRKMDIVNDNGGSSSSSTASTSASSQEPKLKKAKSDAATSIPSPADIYLQPSCVFSGVTSQKGFDPYPFMLTVSGRTNNEVTGTVNWPTLNNTTTKFRGKVDGDEFSFEEYELVVGDDVEVPNSYKGTLASDGSMHGTLADSHNEPGTWNAKNTFRLAAPKDFFRIGSEWKGICHVPFPFELSVTQRKGTSFKGTMRWPTLGDSRTKVKGSFADGEMKLEEYKVIKGEDQVDVPNFFTATGVKEDDQSFTGKLTGESAGGGDSEGTFQLSLVAHATNQQ